MLTDVTSKLNKQEYDNRLSNQFVNTSISRVQNYNKNLDDRIDDIWRRGPQLINDVINRKFTTPQIVDNRNIKIDGSDDDDNFEDEPETKNDIDYEPVVESKQDDDIPSNIPQDPPDKPQDTTQDTPLEAPPNMRQPSLRKRIKINPPPVDTPVDTPVKLKSKKRIKSTPKTDITSNSESEIKAALDELNGITSTDLDKDQLKKYGTILTKSKIQFGSNTKKKARVIQLLQTALDKK
jgi:hypothetical protein